MQGTAPSYRRDIPYVRSYGSVMWGNITFSAIRSEERIDVYVVGMVEDITQRLLAIGKTAAGFFSTPMGEAMLFISETDRDRTSSNLPPRVLHEYELPAFAAPLTAITLAVIFVRALRGNRARKP